MLKKPVVLQPTLGHVVLGAEGNGAGFDSELVA
jgi:hypothetical protein